MQSTGVIELDAPPPGPIGMAAHSPISRILRADAALHRRAALRPSGEPATTVGRSNRRPAKGPLMALTGGDRHPRAFLLFKVDRRCAVGGSFSQVDPQRTDRFPRSGLLQYGLITTCLALSALCCEAHQPKAQAVELCP
jgi:hypothetical protein